MAAAWAVVLSAVAAVSAMAEPPRADVAAVVETTVRLQSPSPRPSGTRAPRPSAAPLPTQAAPAAPKRAVTDIPIAGKGMWIYELNKIAGGNAAKIAWLAKQQNLTHIFVRVGSSAVGLKTLNQVGAVLPHAHQYGIKVIAWYFPYFNDLAADLARSKRTIDYRWGVHAFDGFAADIEPAVGSALSAVTVQAYSSALRAQSPDAYLIAVPPRPTETTIARFPYDVMMPHYDAVAPMVYWGRFSPEGTVSQAIRFLSKYGKPVAPIGQTYDMYPEGGPRGNPPAHQIASFIDRSKQLGAVGVSFWSWQHATSSNWRAIRRHPW